MLLLVGVAACSTSNSGTPTPTAGAAKSADELPAPDSAVAASAAGTSDYIIQPLDVLDVSVFQVADLSKTVQVSSSGQISLPLIGELAAAGETVRGLEAKIAAKLGAKYLQSPQVSVFVKEFTSQRVTVEGAVNSPGIYSITGKTTLLQAIALAKGLDRVADPKGIIVFRTIDGKKNAAAFNLLEIRSGRATDPVLYGGDVVVVDESGMKATMRNIRESIGMFGLFTPLLL